MKLLHCTIQENQRSPRGDSFGPRSWPPPPHRPRIIRATGPRAWHGRHGLGRPENSTRRPSLECPKNLGKQPGRSGKAPSATLQPAPVCERCRGVQWRSGGQRPTGRAPQRGVSAAKVPVLDRRREELAGNVGIETVLKVNRSPASGTLGKISASVRLQVRPIRGSCNALSPRVPRPQPVQEARVR